MQSLFAQNSNDFIKYTADLTNPNGSDIVKTSPCDLSCYKLQICDVSDTAPDFENMDVYLASVKYTMNGTANSSVINSFNGGINPSYTVKSFSSSYNVVGHFGDPKPNLGDCQYYDLCIKRVDDNKIVIDVEVKVDYNYIDFFANPAFTISKTFKFTFTIPPATPNTLTNIIIGKPGTVTKISTQHSTNNGNTPNGFPLLLPSVAIVTPQIFRIEGTLEIDEDYTFGTDKKDLTTIIMGSKAKIFVRSPNILTVNADISGCGEMWDRIEVEKGAQLRVEGSKIRDAYTAVYSIISSGTKSTSIIINNSEFTNNYINVSASGKSYILAVTNSKFNRKGSLLRVPYSATVKDLPYIGIELKRGASLLINENNLFSGLANGIRSYNSENATIYSKSNIFVSIGQAENTYDINGYAIYFDVGAFSVLKVSDCYFGYITPRQGTTDSWAIYSSGLVDVDIQTSAIDDAFHGVDCSAFYNISIFGCAIGAQGGMYPDVWDGVRLTNAYPNGISIEDNKIYGNGTNLALRDIHSNNNGVIIRNNLFRNHENNCIYMNNCNGSSVCNIVSNKFSLFTYYPFFGSDLTGIDIEKCDNILIQDNYIHEQIAAYDLTPNCAVHNPPTSISISENSKNILTVCNTIKQEIPETYCTDPGFNLVQPFPSGGTSIKCSDMSNSSIIGNDITCASIAIELGGDNILMSEQLQSNSLTAGGIINNLIGNSTYSGLGIKLSNFFNKDPIIGTQTYTKNLFLYDGYSTCALNEGDPAQSKFTVDATLISEYLPETFKPQPWFKDLPGDAEVLSCAKLKPTKKRCFSDVDIDIIRNGLNNEYYGENLDWITRSRYYYTIRDNDDFDCYNEFVDNFMDSNADSDIGRHFEVEKIKRSLFSLTKEEKTSLDKLELQKIEITKKIALLDVKNNETVNKEGNALIQQLDKINADIAQVFYTNKVNSIPLVKKAKNINNSTAQDETILPYGAVA